MAKGRRIFILWSALLAVGWVTPAAGQSGPERVDLVASQAALRGGNLDEARSALEALGVSGSPRALPLLVAYVRAGPPGQLVETAVEAIGAIGGAGTGPILVELMTHRRPGVRVRAAEALANLRGREAAGALERGLDDSDAAVRAAAARALARTGTRDSVAVLFRALSKGVFEAAPSIGALGNGADAERFTALLGRVPFDKMAPGLEAFLERRELGTPARLLIVRKLQELATIEVKAFLQAFLDGMPPRERGPVREATEEAIARIAD